MSLRGGGAGELSPVDVVICYFFIKFELKNAFLLVLS